MDLNYTLRLGMITMGIILCTYLPGFGQIGKELKKVNEYRKLSFLSFRNNKEKPRISEAAKVMSDSIGLDKGNSFVLKEKKIDDIGFTHLIFEQFYNNIKVEYGVFSAHGKDNAIDYITGNYIPIKNVDLNSKISLEQSIQAALKVVGAKKYMWEDDLEEGLLKNRKDIGETSYYPRPELVVIKDGFALNGQFRLAYKVKIYAAMPRSHRIYYIDAINSKLLYIEELIKHANSPGIGQTRYSGSQVITTDSYSGGYRLRETRNGVSIQTLNMSLGTSYGAATDFVDNDNNWTSAEHNNSTKDNAALDAHWGTEMVYDYFYNNHGRNSWNNSGGSLLSYVHANLVGMGYSSNDNAFWDGQRMTYGDGQSYSPLTSLDVTAHEIGHGIMSSTANLTYNKESGALNEGFSDIWAACVEANAAPLKQRWTIGEDISIFGTGLRSMSNPNSLGQPDTYGGTYWVNVLGCSPNSSNDYCGVHTNSGVLNYWFYLLSEGGSGTNDLSNIYSVTGIGITDAAKIAYRTITVTLTNPSATFNDTRTASIQAAIDLFGETSCQVKGVIDAWYAVGVGGGYAGTLGLYISGPSNLCSEAIYSIPNLPSGATVNWSVEGWNIEITASSGSQATISRLDNGFSKVKATITTGCGIVVVEASVVTGLPYLQGVELYCEEGCGGTNILCTDPGPFSSYANILKYNFSTNPPYPLKLHYMVIDNTYPNIIYQDSISVSYSGYHYLPTSFLAPGFYNLEVWTSGGPCNESTEWLEIWFEVVSCSGSSGRMVIYPNPSNTELKIAYQSTDKSAATAIKNNAKSFNVKLLNNAGKVLKEGRTTQDVKDVTLQVADVPNGTYFLHIYEGKEIIKKQVIISH